MATYTTIRQYFRQHTDIPWYEESLEYRQHVDATYHATGKIISSVTELDEDQLVMTRTVVWNNEESRNAFIADQIVIDDFSRRTIYLTVHSIVFKIVYSG